MAHVIVRGATLLGVRAAGLAVGILATTAGIVYAVAATLGPQVLWVLEGPSDVSGLVDLRLELRLVHAATVLVACATVATMAFLLAGLARRVSRGVEFVPAVSRTAGTLAGVLALGSWLAQIGENIAVHSGIVYPDTGDWTTMDPAALPLRWESGPFIFLPDLPYLGLALVLALLAWIIQSGERLQRDAEGLV
jgi:hypothetical protein